jgi:hypothetical protein
MLSESSINWSAVRGGSPPHRCRLPCHSYYSCVEHALASCALRSVQRGRRHLPRLKPNRTSASSASPPPPTLSYPSPHAYDGLRPMRNAQVCLLIFHAVSCLDRRTSFLLSSAMAHWRTAITHAPAELCMPSVRNKSYVYAHCPHAAKLASPLDLIVHGSADLLARSAATSGCVDGGYGGYPSLLDACVAAMNMQVQLPRNHAILTLQAQLCFLFVQARVPTA